MDRGPTTTASIFLHVMYDQKWPRCTVPTMKILSCHSKKISFTKCFKTLSDARNAGNVSKTWRITIQINLPGTAVPSAKCFPTRRPWRRCVLDASQKNKLRRQRAGYSQSVWKPVIDRDQNKMKTTEGLEMKASDVARKHRWFNCLLSIATMAT